MWDFNLEPNDPCMKSFLISNSFTNLIKTYTCFKGAGSCIDLVRTNGKYSFQYTRSDEPGLGDQHQAKPFCTMLKTTFVSTEPKLLKYRCN